MSEDARLLPGEQLRHAMRHWASGVSIVTGQAHDAEQGLLRHGMTVNSFVSISIDPPVVSVTLANVTRTYGLVRRSGWFGVTILSQDQAHLSDIFAGRVPENEDRFAGVDTFTLSGNVPLIGGGLAALECRVIHEYALPNSTLFVGAVQAVGLSAEGGPLLYYNRAYHRLEA